MSSLNSTIAKIAPERIYATFENYDYLLPILLLAVFSTTAFVICAVGFNYIQEAKASAKQNLIVFSLLALALSSIVLTNILFDKIEDSKNAALSQAEEDISEKLDEKYRVKLRESPFVADPNYGTVELSKELFNATSADGKNIQISIELQKLPKDIIAYSSGTELPSKK